MPPHIRGGGIIIIADIEFVCLSVCLSLFLSLSLHYSGESCLTVFIEAKRDGGGGDNWSYESYKASVTTSKLTQAGCPTNSVGALTGKILSRCTDLFAPAHGDFQLCVNQ